MKKIIFLTLLYATRAVAQNNTNSFPVYFDESFSVCNKEDVFFKGKAFANGKQTEVILYHTNGERAFIGSYKDKLLKVRNGLFTWYDTTGKKVRIVNFDDNVMNGVVVSWFDNGKLRDSGFYRNGFPDAVWKSWYPSGALRAITTFSAKKLKDFRETYAARPSAPQLPSSYEVFDLSPGSVTPYLSYGTSTASELYAYAKANNYNLPMVSQDKVEQYVNSREAELSGYRQYNGQRNGNAARPNAMPHGLYISYYEKGAVKDSGYFKEGSMTGIWQSWYQNGQPKTIGKYENSRKSGEWKFYGENGKLQYIRKYKWNGLLENEIKMN